MAMHLNPFTYRPSDPSGEDGPEDWEDNWLSNGFAWFADHVLTKWCKTPEHWSSRLANYFWTDCPCCLFWRSAITGAIFGVAFASVVAYII